MELENWSKKSANSDVQGLIPTIRGFDVTGCQKACATTDALSVTIGGSSSSVRNPREGTLGRAVLRFHCLDGPQRGEARKKQTR